MDGSIYMYRASGIRRKFKTNIRLLKLERKTKGGGWTGTSISKKDVSKLYQLCTVLIFLLLMKGGVGLKGGGA